jgi:hypothetical protein
MAVTTLVQYIDRLRLQVGDTDAAAYRYINEWLLISLVAAVESLQSWWNFRYLVDDNDHVFRNTGITFEYAEPPIIQRSDIRPIILMASIIIKSGGLENFSWNLGSWRDAEISFSNIEGGRAKDSSITRDWEELKGYLKPPQKKLAFSRKCHLPGYVGNTYEHGDDINDTR